MRLLRLLVLASVIPALALARGGGAVAAVTAEAAVTRWRRWWARGRRWRRWRPSRRWRWTSACARWWLAAAEPRGGGGVSAAARSRRCRRRRLPRRRRYGVAWRYCGGYGYGGYGRYGYGGYGYGLRLWPRVRILGLAVLRLRLRTGTAATDTIRIIPIPTLTTRLTTTRRRITTCAVLRSVACSTRTATTPTQQVPRSSRAHQLRRACHRRLQAAPQTSSTDRLAGLLPDRFHRSQHSRGAHLSRGRQHDLLDHARA